MDHSSFQYDPAFISGMQQGDRWCFELMYRLTIDNLKMYVIKRSKYYLSVEGQEDLISTAYYHLFKCRAKITCFDDCGAFLFTQSKQLLIDEYRKSKSPKNRPVEFNFSNDIAEEPQEHDKEYYFSLLKIGIDQLTGRYKQVMILLFYENKTMLEVSQELGITRQTILNLKNRAITKLMQKLQPKGKRIGNIGLSKHREPCAI